MAESFDEAFAKIQQLAVRFADNKARYLSSDYLEAEVRKDFIDKFFIALGWDVNHDTQTNPYEQEVKVERGVYHETARKRADYAFFLAPNFHDVRFFVEAKKPSGDFASADNYFQTLVYGWGSKKTARFSVLTSFEDFHILDCFYKPDINNTLSRIVERFSYTDYTDREKFSRIYYLFSREAVANGSLEKFAATRPTIKDKRFHRGLFKGGDINPDDAFLEELDGYRKKLARAFKKSNPKLNGELLTEVTQRTLDRLVFTRFLEDKMIESLQVENFGKQNGVWEDFITTSLRLDRKYNGIVYKYHPILDPLGSQPDGQVFTRICEELSDPTSPYNFSTIPIHILGSIYERFLSKVIADNGEVVDKPEVRKDYGVYYTPEYVVRYIVEHTVGKLIEGRTPAQIAEMKFADIACGSGSFLLEVYDILLRYHSKYYSQNPKQIKKGDCVKRDGTFHLSIQKKRDILINNIYGADIDRQAMEVAQLSLYLKLLEDETIGSTSDFQTEFHYTLLPSLEKNIVCGNSLIGTDILTDDTLSEEVQKKINPMDYGQRFSQIMKQGGFDAIVGNPPYIFTRNEGISPVEKAYYYRTYKHQSAQLNTFGLFLEKSTRLLKQNGHLGFITPNNWLTIDSFSDMRRFLLENTADLSIVNLLDRVFEAADVDTAITLFKKANPTQVTLAEMQAREIIFSKVIPIEQIHSPAFIIQIGLFKDTHSRKLIERIASVARPLSEFATVSTGLKVYQTGKGKPPQTDREKNERVFHNTTKKGKDYGRYLEGVDVSRFCLSWSGEYLNYGDWIAEPRRSVPFDGERLLIRQIPSKPPYLVHGVFTDEQFYNDINSMVVFAPSSRVQLKYLLGVINSALVSFWFARTYDKLQRKIFPQFKVKELALFPICTIDFSRSADKSRHDKMVSLVEQILAAKEQLAGAQSDKDRDFYENKCAGLDRQIDALVYELYGLSPDEIKIVEGAK